MVTISDRQNQKRKMKLRDSIIVVICTLYLIGCLCSCRTTKYVTKTEYKKDSTAIYERDSLSRLIVDNQKYYQHLIETLGENNIIFRDTGRVEIVYRPDGSIESVKGEVRSLNSRLQSSQNENFYWRSKYDSLSHIKRKDSVILKTDYKTVEVKKKVTVFPWWFWLICASALIVGTRLGKIKIPFI